MSRAKRWFRRWIWCREQHLVPTDVPNTLQGGVLYAQAKIRPRWYWWYRRLRLFLGIVWRPVDTPEGAPPVRLSVRQAWQISKPGGLSY